MKKYEKITPKEWRWTIVAMLVAFAAAFMLSPYRQSIMPFGQPDGGVIDRSVRHLPSALEAPEPTYFVRPSEMEEAAAACPDGELAGLGVTTKPVVVFHIACKGGVVLKMDKTTGRTFKRVVS